MHTFTSTLGCVSECSRTWLWNFLVDLSTRRSCFQSLARGPPERLSVSAGNFSEVGLPNGRQGTLARNCALCEHRPFGFCSLVESYGSFLPGKCEITAVITRSPLLALTLAVSLEGKLLHYRYECVRFIYKRIFQVLCRGVSVFSLNLRLFMREH